MVALATQVWLSLSPWGKTVAKRYDDKAQQLPLFCYNSRACQVQVQYRRRINLGAMSWLLGWPRAVWVRSFWRDLKAQLALKSFM